MIEASAHLGLTVDEISVEGRKETKAELLLDALGVKRGAPLLAFDLDAARTRLEALPWVRKAAIERRWPNLIYLRIEERHAVALWQYRATISVVDEDGAPIAGVDVHRFASLPMVVGEGASKQASTLVAMLAASPDLAAHVTSAVWVGNRRWNLELQEGIELRLPEADPAGAFARFAALDRQQRLIARDVVIIDLRLPDKLIMRLAPNAAPSPSVNGKAGKNT
jgi:cell division protein FtsQ